VWTEGEVVRLYKHAWRERYYGLGAVIAVLWSTQQSPGDVRTLVASQLVTDGAGAVFLTDRAKTGKPVGGALSDRALAAVEAYVQVLGVELHGDAPSHPNHTHEQPRLLSPPLDLPRSSLQTGLVAKR
jgi:hypothetical protein